MKKITSKLLVFMLVFVMSFGLTACGDSSGAEKDNATSSTNDTSGTSDASSGDDSQSTDDDKDDSTAGSGKFSSLSDYINADEVKEGFSALEKALEGTGMSMNITAEDNKLIYTYKYDEIEKTDDMSKQLEESIAERDATFQDIANEIKEYVDVDSASVLIKYIDCNDDEIFSKEYVSE